MRSNEAGGGSPLRHPSGRGVISTTLHYGRPSYVEDPPGGPYGWIQWKGTRVCMDIHCVCGTHGHIDAEFAYFVRCKDCNRVYSVGQNVLLYELPPELRPGHESVEPIKFGRLENWEYELEKEEEA